MRRLVLLLTTLACLAVPAALAKGSFPETIPLPNGFAARGDRGRQGRHVLRRLDSDRRRLRRQPPHRDRQRPRPRRDGPRRDRAQVRPRPAVGLGRGDRQGVRLRRPNGRARPASTSSRPAQARRSSTTSSSRGGRVLHRLATGRDLQGRDSPARRAGGALTAITLTGDYQHVAGFNLNGIDATPNGKTLLAVQSATGKLFTIDPKTGATKLIDLGGATLPNGDGILLHGRTLYVVQNQLNKIAVVQAEPRPHAGRRHPDDHRLRLRRADDDRQVRQVALRRQRPLRHGERRRTRRIRSSRCAARSTSNEGCEAPPQPPKPEVSSSAAEGVTACVRRRHRFAPLPASSGSA